MPDLADHAGTGAHAASPLREAKLALRRTVLAARDALPAGTRAIAGAAIGARIDALASFRAAGSVLLTMAFRSEWDTSTLVGVAMSSAKVVALPRIDAEARMIEICVIRDPVADVGPGHQGIPEPRMHCPVIAPDAIDWVLVPGVAFDRRGRRLGYGAGYYDRLLPMFRAGTRRVAGAFDLQLVDAVPVGPHDLGVDTIVTESQVIDIVRE